MATFFILAAAAFSTAGGQQDSASKKSPRTKDNSLVKKQAVLADRVEQLESKLLKLVEFESDQNPERAKILQQTLELAQSAEVSTNLKQITEMLRRGATSDYDRAVEQQKKILDDLNRLYDLLESSDRLKSQRIKAAKIRSRINRIEQLIQQQRGIRQRLEAAPNAKDLKPDQERLASKTGDLENEIAKESGDKSEPTKSTKDSSADEKSSQKKPDEPNQQSTKASEQDPPNPSISNETQVSKSLKSASNKMQKAADQLDSKAKTKAATEMESAEQELDKAKQTLEESLRQNREEEIESTLRSLDERLQNLLKQQLKINSETKSLNVSGKPAAEIRIVSFRLSGVQRKTIADLDKALLMLSEEGSSRSIPNTLYHVKLDMIEVASQLELSKLDEGTITLQKDIVDVLSELIQAVKQEQQDQKNLKKMTQQPGGGGGQMQQRPLVQKIAELKIIRQLQVRINGRHEGYAKNLTDAKNESDVQKLKKKTKELSVRQQQLEKTTLELINAGDR